MPQQVNVEYTDDETGEVVNDTYQADDVSAAMDAIYDLGTVTSFTVHGEA